MLPRSQDLAIFSLWITTTTVITTEGQNNHFISARACGAIIIIIYIVSTHSIHYFTTMKGSLDNSLYLDEGGQGLSVVFLEPLFDLDHVNL